MAETTRFERMKVLPLPRFKLGAIDHSATFPLKHIETTNYGEYGTCTHGDIMLAKHVQSLLCQFPVKVSERWVLPPLKPPWKGGTRLLSHVRIKWSVWGDLNTCYSSSQAKCHNQARRQTEKSMEPAVRFELTRPFNRNLITNQVESTNSPQTGSKSAHLSYDWICTNTSGAVRQ